MAGSLVAESTAVGGTGSLSPTLPAGSAANDVIFIATATRDATNTCATPSNWSLIQTAGDDGTGKRLYVFARRYDGVWSMPSVTWSGTSVQRSAKAFAIRGLKTSGTIADITVATSRLAGDAAAAGYTFPALTLSSGTDLFLVAVSGKAATADTDGHTVSNVTAPSGWTNAAAGKGAAGNSTIIGAWYQQQSGSASSTIAATPTISPDENPNSNVTGIVVAFQIEAPPAVTFDASTKTISASTTTSLTVTASPVFGSAMTTLTSPGGDTISAESGATTSSATFLLPALTQFASGGSMNNTRMGQSGSWTVTDGTSNATASLTIQPPSGYIIKTLTATTGAIPADITGEAIGDDILVWGDDLLDVDTVGDVNVSAIPTTVNYRWYDVSGSAWQADDSITVGTAVVLTATTDQSSYAVGEDIVISLSPDDEEAPNALTLGGVNVFADFTASGTTGGTLAAPAVSDFLPAGALNTVPWFQFVDLTVGFAVAADTTTEILFEAPAGSNTSGAVYWAGSVGANPDGMLTGYTEGDPWLVVADPGVIDTIVNGEVYTIAEGNVQLYVYHTGVWNDEGRVFYWAGSPETQEVKAGAAVTLDLPHFVGDDGNAVYTIQSGTLPTGMSINSATGVISGTPAAETSYPVTYSGIVVRATDGLLTADTDAFSIVVNLFPAGSRRQRMRGRLKGKISFDDTLLDESYKDVMPDEF